MATNRERSNNNFDIAKLRPEMDNMWSFRLDITQTTFAFTLLTELSKKIMTVWNYVCVQQLRQLQGPSINSKVQGVRCEKFEVLQFVAKRGGSIPPKQIFLGFVECKPGNSLDESDGLIRILWQ